MSDIANLKKAEEELLSRKSKYNNGSADGAVNWYKAVREQQEGWVVTQKFANNFEGYYKESKGYHAGIDTKRVENRKNVTENTPIFPDNPGVIIRIDKKDNGGYGLHVRIDIGDGFVEVNAHMSEIAPELKVGSYVDTTTSIGFGGSTGNSTGPHLHREIFHDVIKKDIDHKLDAGFDGSSVTSDYANIYRICVETEESWYQKEDNN